MKKEGGRVKERSERRKVKDVKKEGRRKKEGVRVMNEEARRMNVKEKREKKKKE